MAESDADRGADEPVSDSGGQARPNGVDAELTAAARGGAITFVGSMFSTLMGFVLTVVFARQLGAEGSGVVLQMIAVFMIALSLGRLGMDTTAVWVLPRLRVESPHDVGSAVSGLLLTAGTVGSLVACAWYATSAWADGGPFAGSQVADALDVVAWMLPIASVMLVGLAATRGFGGVWPFNLVGNIGVPGSRPVLVLVVTLAGGSLLAASLAWAAPFAAGALVTVLVLWRRVRQFGAARGAPVSWRPTWLLQRRLFGFGLPRTLSSMLEQSIIWFDVLLVGLIAGPAAAGVYGATSRFVGAGVVVLTAFRVVVAPRFSALMAQRREVELRELYQVTASWILLFGTPAYMVLAVFSPTVLGWLGADFVEGATAMTVLSVGALFLLAGGNVQSLLLMSGHSGWSAINRTIVFSVNVLLNVLLVPQYGVTGAAVAWASCMALDTTLAVIMVFRFTGVRPALGRLLRVLVAAVATTVVPCALIEAALGQRTVAVVVALPCVLVCVFLYGALDRRGLRLDLLAGLLPGRMPHPLRRG